MMQERLGGWRGRGGWELGNGGSWTVEISMQGFGGLDSGLAVVQHVLVITLAGQIHPHHQRTENKERNYVF